MGLEFLMVRICLALIAASALALPASSVLAHARLVAASPASGTIVSAPRTISLTFSERFAAPFSTIKVEDSRGRAVGLTKAVTDDGKTLSGSFAAPLTTGVYRVTWAIAAADGHRMTGTYSFTVL
jgi:copper resistance protein C